MNFNEKLQFLRKENKLSQEQLADMLDVTRQSVSKWESGTTYPEMDKLIMLCKIFKCSLDDLTNDEITKINFEDKKGAGQNNFLNNILEIINKTVQMFRAMSFKQIVGCIVSMLILALVLLIFRVPFELIEDGLEKVIVPLLTNIRAQKIVMGIFCFILDIIYYALYILVYVYIYKIAFLDKYQFINSKETKEVLIDNNINIESTNNPREIMVINKEPKENSLFKLLGGLALGFIKFLLILFSIPVIFILGFLFFLIAIDVYIIFDGIFFIGILLGLLFSALLVIWFLILVSSFIFNKKMSFKKMLIVFLVGIVGIGISSGIIALEISSLEYKKDVPNDFVKKVEHFEKDISDDMYLSFRDYYGHITYVEDNSLENISIDVTYYEKMYDFLLVDSESVIDFKTIYSNEFDRMKFVFEIFKDGLKEKSIYDLDSLVEYEIKISGSKENIKKIKDNTEKYEKELKQKEYEDCYYCETSVSDCERENESLILEIERLKEEIEELKYREDE